MLYYSYSLLSLHSVVHFSFFTTKFLYYHKHHTILLPQNITMFLAKSKVCGYQIMSPGSLVWEVAAGCQLGNKGFPHACQPHVVCKMHESLCRLVCGNPPKPRPQTKILDGYSLPQLPISTQSVEGFCNQFKNNVICSEKSYLACQMVLKLPHICSHHCACRWPST